MENYLDFLARSTPLLLKGTMTTLKVFLVSSSLSFALGLLFGLFLCERLRIPFLSSILEGGCFVLRAVPFYVQLLIVYFVLPDLLGFSLPPFSASTIALGFCSSGYVAQIVRAGINSIPRIQWESAFNLGFTSIQSVRLVIMPQMVRHVLPAFINELDSLLKSTAIVSSIGMLELTRVGMNLVSREMEPVPIYLTVACVYLTLSAVLNLFAKITERKLAYAKH